MTDQPEYTLKESIRELNGYLRHGKRMFPIDVAVSSLHWLRKAPTLPPTEAEVPTMFETICAIDGWLGNANPDLPLHVCESALYWLRRVALASGGEGKSDG